MEQDDCIAACRRCHEVCLSTATGHCLQTGGRHVEPRHYRLMLNCAEVCQLSANFQLSGSEFSSQLCALCAHICRSCAQSCSEIGGMDDCVRACQECAASCDEMSVSLQQ